GFNGITFDTVGSFRNRLLVTSGQAGKTIVNAIDCNGSVETISRSAPRIEGGIEVAPKEFGAFGGTLIAPDELGGNIYAIAADGGARMISVHCSAACAKVDVVSSATRAHGEGHLAFRVNVPTASPSPSLRPTPSTPQTNPTSSASSVPIALIAVIAALVVLGVAVLAVVAVRRG